MAHSYSVDAVLQFLDVGLPEEKDSDDKPGLLSYLYNYIYVGMDTWDDVGY